MRLFKKHSKPAAPQYNWPSAFSAEVVEPVFGGVSAYVIALEAWRRGLTVTATRGGLSRFRVQDDHGRVVRFVNSRPTTLSTTAGRNLARDKYKTNRLLAQAGLPVPEADLIEADQTTNEDLVRRAAAIGYPIVLKPPGGSKGDGVFTGIDSDAALIEYYEYLINSLGCTQVVMEAHVSGDADVRVLVVADRMVGGIHRVPANIIGDGRHTIDQLIDQKNMIRAHNPFLHSGPIRRDNEVLNYIKGAGHTLDTVLDDGTYLRLRGKSNGSAGGDSIDITDDLPESIALLCVQAVQAIPGQFCGGVDVLYDTSRPEESVQIIEVNATPQIGLNMYPMVGQGRDAPKIWIDACFPDSARSGIAGEETLTFSIDEVVTALRSGAASEVTIAPIPPQRLPHRRRYVLDSDASLDSAAQKRLVVRARRLGLSGSLQGASGQRTLKVAGESTAACDEFAALVAKRLAVAAPLTHEPWNEVVRLAFRVDN